MAAGPPAVPTEQNGGVSRTGHRPQATGAVPQQSSLNVEGIGFRGLSEVTVQFGDEDPVAVRVDQTGTMSTTFPATGTDAPAPPSSPSAVVRPGPFARWLAQYRPCLRDEPDGMVPWFIVVPVVGSPPCH